jgi:hypothetical protein
VCLWKWKEGGGGGGGVGGGGGCGWLTGGGEEKIIGKISNKFSVVGQETTAWVGTAWVGKTRAG